MDIARDVLITFTASETEHQSRTTMPSLQPPCSYYACNCRIADSLRVVTSKTLSLHPISTQLKFSSWSSTKTSSLH